MLCITKAKTIIVKFTGTFTKHVSSDKSLPLCPAEYEEEISYSTELSLSRTHKVGSKTEALKANGMTKLQQTYRQISAFNYYHLTDAACEFINVKIITRNAGNTKEQGERSIRNTAATDKLIA